MGDDMRKLNVTPKGMPDSTKPINRGQAEQEQNGVTTPSMAASMLPKKSFFATQKAASPLRCKETANNGDEEDDDRQ